MKTRTTETGFGSAAVISVLAVLILGGGAYFLSADNKMAKDKDEDMVPQETSEKMMDDVSHETDSMMKKDEMMDKSADAGGTMMKDDPKLNEMSAEELAADGPAPVSLSEIDEETLVGQESGAMAKNPGSFEDYSPEKLALAKTGDVILFFHADWCPSCRGLEKDINDNLSNIPEGTHILKIDYDTAMDLKKKYGVVRQHTLVHVSETGAEIKKLTGLTNTLNQVVSQI